MRIADLTPDQRFRERELLWLAYMDMVDILTEAGEREVPYSEIAFRMRLARTLYWAGRDNIVENP